MALDGVYFQLKIRYKFNESLEFNETLPQDGTKGADSEYQDQISQFA
jgi:hypothetical protein